MITALYAIPIAILFLALSYRVILFRRANKLGLGDGGNKSLEKRMRAQANCAEYAPFALLLMALVELQDGAAWAVHVIGVLLLVGRVLHAYGFSASPPVMRLRVSGMILTMAAYLVAIGCLIALAIIGGAPA
jgi:uncharacterized membrane protein YecN with MAPEG domain